MKHPILRMRREYAKIQKQQNGHTAVIVKSYISLPTKYGVEKVPYLGIQFWNESMIKSGECTNTDKTTSKFVAFL